MELFLANTIPVEKLTGEFGCRCGGHQTLTTDIRFGSGAAASLMPALEGKIAKNVKVVVAATRHAYGVQGAEIESMLKKSYKVAVRVFESCAPALESAHELIGMVDDETRAIIAIGGQSVCDIAKYAAHAAKLPLAYVATTPAMLYALQPHSALFDGNLRNIFKTVAPEILIMDLDAVTKAPEAHRAAAFGHIMALSLTCFDRYFTYVLSKEQYCGEVTALIRSAQDALFADADLLAEGDKAAVCRLAENAVRTAVYLQIADTENTFAGGETLFAFTQELYFINGGRSRRLFGENAFIGARFLSGVYKLMLSEKLPEFQTFDDILRVEMLGEYLGISEYAALPNMPKIPDAALFEHYRYMAAEYNSELLGAIEDCSARLLKAEKTFRRMYPDSGMWTKKYLTEDDLRIILALSPDIRPKFTMLSYIKHMGLLDTYLVYN